MHEFILEVGSTFDEVLIMLVWYMSLGSFSYALGRPEVRMNVSRGEE